MKKNRIYLIILVMLFCATGCSYKSEEAKVIDLTTNNKVNPIGIDGAVYFSWKMQDSVEGQKQTAYQIMLSDTAEKLNKGEYVWDSGKVMSDCSVAVPYSGNLLEAENDYFWQVKVWDKDGKENLSEVVNFEIGKDVEAWENTYWIKAPKIEDDRNNVDEAEVSMVSEIAYEFKMEETESGFIWGAMEGQYGEYYMWSFDVANEQVKMDISRRRGDEVLDVKEEIVLAWEAEKFLNQSHSVSIEIKEGKAFTYVDDVLVSQGIVLETCEVGGVGFWVTRGVRNAWYDNLLIKNQKGESLYQENFEAKETIFDPYYIKVEEGWGRADSGVVMTPGGEIPAPMFRKTFKITDDKEIDSVRLYASALGIYDIYINGIDVNSLYAAPGQSVYNKEVYYRTYDLTEYAVSGVNAIGIMLGHGRYDRAKGKWGDELTLYAQLVIRYKDGTRQIVGTDDTWSVYMDGPVRSDDIFCGEYYDANYEQEGWTLPEFVEEKDGEWMQAEYYKDAEDISLRAAPDAGVRCIDIVTPISVTEPVDGVYVYDFGRNFNGVCKLQFAGEKGDTVTMRYGEYLNTEMLQRKDDEIGTIWTRNQCTADNTDYYTFEKDGECTYSPGFTYRGFRYLQISGIDEPLPLENVEGLILSTANVRNGYFECSDEKMNRLYNAIYLSQLSNYVDIPTDCPQRDERLGWTGDAQVFAYTGSLNANTADFIYKYIDILRISQNEEGAYQQIVPFVDTVGGANGWSDAGIILVWEMYQQYGNKQLIVENLSAMSRYVDYLVATSDGFIRNRKDYNDHNALSYMDDGCCNTAQCAYVARLLAQMCDAIGEAEMAEKYRDIYEQYLIAWRKNYLREDGSIGEWRQSEYAIALAYQLYPEELEQSGADKLNMSIEASDYHIATGYITTPHILSLLCKYGYVETAYKVIQKTGYPSWNYMLEQTTALTEAWNTLIVNESGEIEINGSLNHVALGAVGQWFYTDVLGIRRDENNPAYKHFYLEPQIGGGLTYAKGSYESVYGKIESAWEVTDDCINLHFVIPANTSATVTLPGEEYQQIELGAGVYEFEVDL